MASEEEVRLVHRLRILLPETYEVFDDEVQPRSMGSAGLKFGPNGKVLWNEMWQSFCDLAMAGGPPHRGKLLMPSVPVNDAQASAVQSVSTEICRGIDLVTGLCAETSPTPGWVRLYCLSAAMSGWLMRAIVMENVAAVSAGLALYLPTGPDFRVEKEIKNVITSVAKTCHFWQGHMSEAKHDEIAALLRQMEADAPLIRPSLRIGEQSEALAELSERAAATIRSETGLNVSRQGYVDWLGIDLRKLDAAIWIMRALAVTNVLARREGTTVFVPLNLDLDGDGAATVTAILRALRIGQRFNVV